MSFRESKHDAATGHHHSWKARMSSWFAMPCSSCPKRPQGVTLQELQQNDGSQKHSRKWIAVDGNVYDVTQYINFHPGGEKVIEECLGRDCTAEYYHNHNGFTVFDAIPECLVGPLIIIPKKENSSSILKEEQEQEGEMTNSSTSAAVAGNIQEEGDDNNVHKKLDENEKGVVREGDNNKNNKSPPALDFEERSTLDELFDTLVTPGSNVLTQEQFKWFLDVSQVSEEEREITMERLEKLLSENNDSSSSAGIDKEMFMSLF